jgi:hypothetical protein
MMALADFEAFLATPGAKTDEQVVAAMTSSGVGAADVARLVGLPEAEVSARVGAVREASFLDFLMAPNLTDAQIVAEINNIGIAPERVSALTNVPLAEVNSRIVANTPGVGVDGIGVNTNTVIPPAGTVTTAGTGTTTGTGTTAGTGTTTRTNQQIFTDFLMQPNLTDAQIASEMRRLGITNQQTADLGGLTLDEVNRRFNALNPEAQFRAFLMTPNLTDAQIVAEMGRLGITNRQTSDISGLDVREIEDRINATSGTMPFANATQAFTQDFNNYQSIPIGAQFNPNVVGGAGSPYSQIMAQMRPVGNPYATARSGLTMGGYDPGIYDAGLLDRVVRERAERNAATTAGSGVIDGGSGGDVGVGDTGFDGGGSDAGSDGVGGVGGAGGPGSTSAANPADFGGSDFFKGGLIGRVFGTDPAGPDEGQINVQRGEYVVKKSSVKKYGKGLLDMINDGKIPAKKIKSLLD